MGPDVVEGTSKQGGGFILSEKKPENGRSELVIVPCFADVSSPSHDSGHPTLYSKISHEASLQPVLSNEYRALVRKRQEKADKPKRTLQRLDEDGIGAGQAAMMASGIANLNTERVKGRFAGFVRISPRISPSLRG